jgi:hypothetical protein
MNRLAVWVAQTAMSVTVPRALAQATASPLTEIEDGAWLDPDIAAQPLVAMNVSLGLEGMARGAAIQGAKIQGAKVQRAKIQRTKSASASNALTILLPRRRFPDS